MVSTTSSSLSTSRIKRFPNQLSVTGRSAFARARVRQSIRCLTTDNIAGGSGTTEPGQSPEIQIIQQEQYAQSDDVAAAAAVGIDSADAWDEVVQNYNSMQHQSKWTARLWAL